MFLNVAFKLRFDDPETGDFLASLGDFYLSEKTFGIFRSLKLKSEIYQTNVTQNFEVMVPSRWRIHF